MTCFIYLYCSCLCVFLYYLVVMAEALVVWHYGGNLMGNMYTGGAVRSQDVDPDRVGFWCLEEFAEEQLNQTKKFRLYFYLENGELQQVHNNASTCLMLSILNDKRKVNMYVVVDNDNGGIGTSASAGGVKYGEGTSRCGFNKESKDVGHAFC